MININHFKNNIPLNTNRTCLQYFQNRNLHTFEAAGATVVSGVDLQDRGIVTGGAPGAGEINGIMIAVRSRINVELVGTVVTVRVRECIRRL